MLYVCLFMLVAMAVVPVQAVAEMGTVRAELTCGHCSSYSNMMVELTDASRQPVSSSSVAQNGGIEFLGLPKGAYTLTVKKADGSVLHQESVQVGSHPTPLSIHLPDDPKQEQRTSEGTISIQRLKHKVPKQARKEYNKADERLREGDIHASLEHLQKAVELDPEYMEAFNNLGLAISC